MRIRRALTLRRHSQSARWGGNRWPTAPAVGMCAGWSAAPGAGERLLSYADGAVVRNRPLRVVLYGDSGGHTIAPVPPPAEVIPVARPMPAEAAADVGASTRGDVASDSEVMVEAAGLGKRFKIYPRPSGR